MVKILFGIARTQGTGKDFRTTSVFGTFDMPGIGNPLQRLRTCKCDDEKHYRKIIHIQINSVNKRIEFKGSFSFCLRMVHLSAFFPLQVRIALMRTLKISHEIDIQSDSCASLRAESDIAAPPPCTAALPPTLKIPLLVSLYVCRKKSR